MAVKIYTTSGEDLTCGKGYFVPLIIMSDFVAEMSAQGFIVSM